MPIKGCEDCICQCSQSCNIKCEDLETFNYLGKQIMKADLSGFHQVFARPRSSLLTLHIFGRQGKISKHTETSKFSTSQNQNQTHASFVLLFKCIYKDLTCLLTSFFYHINHRLQFADCHLMMFFSFPLPPFSVPHGILMRSFGISILINVAAHMKQ